MTIRINAMVEAATYALASVQRVFSETPRLFRPEKLHKLNLYSPSLTRVTQSDSKGELALEVQVCCASVVVIAHELDGELRSCLMRTWRSRLENLCTRCICTQWRPTLHPRHIET